MAFDWRSAISLCSLLLLSTALVAESNPIAPPKHVPVTIVVFGDLQCSDCAATEPLLQEAAAKYALPIVRRDFPLPKHAWAFEAHVIARYFDTISPELGEQFRRWVMDTQKSINKENLVGMASRFAAQHKCELPESYDAQGKLRKLVESDVELGHSLGLIHTPTVYVVTQEASGEPLIETVEREALFAKIEKAQAAAGNKQGDRNR